jgi:hypothetical protein
MSSNTASPFKLFHFRKYRNGFLEMIKGASSVWYQDRRENWIVFHHDDVGENDKGLNWTHHG